MRFSGGIVAFAVAATACDCGPPSATDAGHDAGRDAGHDAGRPDAGTDAGAPDSGSPDAGPDGGPPDSGPIDAGSCGDGIIEPTEQCDDGNASSGDGCAGNCSGVEFGYLCPSDGGPCTFTAVCGDAVLEVDERCDDGNLDAGDGCSNVCTLEAGWRCPVPGQPCLAARCGDGALHGQEDCDDGNLAPGDGCDATCRIEPGYACPAQGGPCTNALCGDHSVFPTESCDDGNDDFDDGCTPICTSEPDCSSGNCFSRCGDRIYQPDAGEQCDDGDLRNGDGCSSTCTIETGYTCTLAPPAALTLPIVLRDFHSTHPDFETFTGDDRSIVLPTLGADGKPQYSITDGGHTSATTSKANFDQWYHDVPGVNLPVRQQLALTPTPDGGLVFGSTAFFPLDGIGFGNEGFPNNFHFTTETRFWFIYRGAEQMHFLGDDDVFIFLNGQLVVNLGGVHGAEAGDVVLDPPTAASLGLTLGGLYEVALFHAERHTVGSTFRLTLLGFNFELSRCTRTCGDGVIDRREDCDDGIDDGGYDRCGPTCHWDMWCGDGIVQAPFEQCDDGVNQTPYGNSGCSPTCQRPHFCGDGYIDSRFGEQCDSQVGCVACRISP